MDGASSTTKDDVLSDYALGICRALTPKTMYWGGSGSITRSILKSTQNAGLLLVQGATPISQDFTILHSATKVPMVEGSIDPGGSHSPSSTPNTEERANNAGWYVVPVLLITYPIWIISFVVAMVGLFFIYLIRRIAGYPKKSEVFRTLERRIVRPRQTVVFRPPLAFQDKAGFPFSIVDFTYFYSEVLDVEVLCESLAVLITDLPLLGGRLRGYMNTLHVQCDRQSGVALTVAESGYTLQHANHASQALKKRDAMHAHGFAASDPWDPFRTIVGSSPVMRVKLTYLAGGGCALSVAVSHSVADARMLMKVVELWASEARQSSSSLPQVLITDTLPLHSGGTEEEEEEGKVPVYAPQPTLRERRPGDEEEERRVTGPARWRLISPLVYDGIGREAAKLVAPLTFRRFFHDYGNMLRGSLDFAKVWFWRGAETEHFFFSDQELSNLKSQVMEELRHVEGLGRPHFVSTTDVLSALLWKACVACPSQQAVKGPHRCLSSLDVRQRLVQPRVLGTEHEGGFPINNCTLAVVSAHADVSSASLLTLSCTLRRAMDDYDAGAAHDRLGQVAQRDGPLGLLMGPECFHWDMRRDVLVSSYSPLQGDTDFGAGRAAFYVADLVPSVAFYIHLNHGVDPLAGDRGGIYASVCAKPEDMAALQAQLSHYLPTPMPPTPEPLPLTHKKHRARGEVEEEIKKDEHQEVTRGAPQGQPDEEKMELESIDLNDEDDAEAGAGATVPVPMAPEEEKKPTRQRWVNGPPRNRGNEPRGMSNHLLDVLGVLVLYVVRLMSMTPRLLPAKRDASS